MTLDIRKELEETLEQLNTVLRCQLEATKDDWFEPLGAVDDNGVSLFAPILQAKATTLAALASLPPENKTALDRLMLLPEEKRKEIIERLSGSS